jgi:hypothetical protein
VVHIFDFALREKEFPASDLQIKPITTPFLLPFFHDFFIFSEYPVFTGWWEKYANRIFAASGFENDH